MPLAAHCSEAAIFVGTRAAMQQAKRVSSSELARKLVADVWDQHGMDPLVLLCLVIPQDDLVGNTVFGGKLLDIVQGIVGVHNMPRLGRIVEAVQDVFMEWDPTALGSQACARGWGKNKTVAELRENVAKACPVFAPCITQKVDSYGKRSFVVYQHFQVYLLCFAVFRSVLR